MLKVGITGGIGSGKSVVCQVFSALGIPVFNPDNAARYMMENDMGLLHSITQLFGAGICTDGKPDRAKIAAIVFNDPEKLQSLNNLVHPATISYAREWIEKQTAPYIIKEAAILFESGSYKDLDVIIGVYAPKELRIQRAMQRSGLSREQALAIIARQMDEDEKMQRCDHVIINDDLTPVLPRVLELHGLFMGK